MVVFYMLVLGVLIIGAMVFIRQVPSVKKKARSYISPLEQLLDEAAYRPYVLSFDNNLVLDGRYQSRQVEIQVDLGRQGFQGAIRMHMFGLLAFPKLPWLLSAYPEVNGDVVHKGKYVALELKLLEHTVEDYRHYLNQLAVASATLEKQAG